MADRTVTDEPSVDIDQTTAIGADGQRHTIGEAPTDPAPYRRRHITVVGPAEEGDDCVAFNAETGNYEWSVGADL